MKLPNSTKRNGDTVNLNQIKFYSNVKHVFKPKEFDLDEYKNCESGFKEIEKNNDFENNCWKVQDFVESVY